MQTIQSDSAGSDQAAGPVATPRQRRPQLSVHELLQRMADGRIESGRLPAVDRRRCVEALTRVGYTVSEMADVLAVDERTIQRDRAAIRRSTARSARKEQRDELLGQYRDLTYESIQRLRRLCNDADASPQVRLAAEKQLTHAMREYVATSTSLPAPEPVSQMSNEDFLKEAWNMLDQAGRRRKINGVWVIPPDDDAPTEQEDGKAPALPQPANFPMAR